MAAKEDYLEIYEDYTDAELDLAISKLRRQVDNPMVSQQEGSRNYTRAVSEIRARLAAATEVKRTRANPNKRRHGQADFSKTNFGA